MKEAYLEVTYRKGRPLAAYIYLPREAGERSCRSSRVEPGLVVDYGPTAKPIGIEITAPEQVSPLAINALLRDLGSPPLPVSDLAPLQAA